MSLFLPCNRIPNKYPTFNEVVTAYKNDGLAKTRRGPSKNGQQALIPFQTKRPQAFGPRSPVFFNRSNTLLRAAGRRFPDKFYGFVPMKQNSLSSGHDGNMRTYDLPPSR
jgi:hypothetical protein